jgi:hypothetical protein
MTEGPYLYDDDPAPLHTGTPRPARALILAVIGGTVAVAVGMAVGLPLVKGSPEEQAREVTGVFLAALAQDDVETAHGLLCAEGGTGEIRSAIADEADGAPVQRVEVAWSDGSTSTLTVVSEQGARVCGTSVG